MNKKVLISVWPGSELYKFYIWLETHYPKVTLTPMQQLVVTTLFTTMGGKGGGKSFLIKLLKEFDDASK